MIRSIESTPEAYEPALPPRERAEKSLELIQRFEEKLRNNQGFVEGCAANFFRNNNEDRTNGPVMFSTDEFSYRVSFKPFNSVGTQNLTVERVSKPGDKPYNKQLVDISFYLNPESQYSTGIFSYYGFDGSKINTPSALGKIESFLEDLS